jgi:hypothetical protein
MKKVTIIIDLEEGSAHYLYAVLSEIIAAHAKASTGDEILPISGSNCGHMWEIKTQEFDCGEPSVQI